MYNKKTWTDRMSEYPNRRTLTKEDGSTEIVSVERNEGEISSEGDAFSAENMNDLEERINQGFESTENILDTLEEIEANTEEGKIAGALALKETNERLINEDGETFNYGVKDGVRGFFTDPSRADDSFVPFKSNPNIILLNKPTSTTYTIVSDYPINYVYSINYYSTGWISSNVSPDGVERWMSHASSWSSTPKGNSYPIVSSDKKTITVRGIITGQDDTIIIYG